MAPQVDQQLHFIMFPLMAQGHMIPMVDMARLFAQRGVNITIVTTPLNTLRFKTVIDREIQAGLPIRLLQLQFPTSEVGLPEGCENYDTLPSRDMVMKFFAAITMLQEPLEQAIKEMDPMPSCIVSDMLFPWTNDTANKFDIPRLIFHGVSCFSLLCSHNIHLHKAHENVTSESEPFVVPDLPDVIEVTKACLPAEFNNSPPEMRDLRMKVRESEYTSYGVLLNSFDALEPKYVWDYQKVKGSKAWCIGPVSFCNKEDIDKAERGNKASIDDHECLKWLDSKEQNSVVYVCLGSLCQFLPLQLIEIGLGLEASNRPFVWVIRRGKNDSELEKWLSEERFVERTKDRGLVIMGWAPQVLILEHQAIGGFLTHCGWNSALEGVCAGLPMITFPMFAEQFLNEKLIGQVLEIGVSVGIKTSIQWGEEEKIGVLVKREDVEIAVNKVMDEGERGEIRREKARELRKMARSAMEEGGSSHLNMTLFIQDIMHHARKKSVHSDKETI
ncbi:Glycosyltransferase [Thalictrum thalictroides]|uniref:Glycosyltransferase n=1 Tax=Thalictrum thalictroides TaxID=46969 RepID=A0A7J6V413_THATH|nr:Glycosyltransferase [Thalictrum thalictroides]